MSDNYRYFLFTESDIMWLGKGIGQICSSPHLVKKRVRFQLPESNNNSDQNEERKKENRKYIKRETYREDIGSEYDVKKRSHSKPRGFLNLSAFLIFLFHLRCSLWLTTPTPPVSLPSWRLLLPERLPIPDLVVLLYPLQAVLVTLTVDGMSEEGRVSCQLASLLHLVTIVTTFTIPVLYLTPQHDLEGLVMNVLVTCSYLVLGMKLLSFLHVRKREIENKSNNNLVNQVNLGYKGFILHLLSPSIVYNPSSIKEIEMNIQRILFRIFQITILGFVVKALFIFISLVTVELLQNYQEGNIVVVLDR